MIAREHRRDHAVGVGSLAGRALQQNGSGAASFGTLQRGAAHAPGPVR